MTSKNIYRPNYPYNSSNPNAISNGDEKGRGERNGIVGTKTDINERTLLIARNKYNSTEDYKKKTIF